MASNIVNSDCVEYLRQTDEKWDVAFADPPDNIGLGYGEYRDRMPEEEYHDWCQSVLWNLLNKVTGHVWWSFNAKHTLGMAKALGYLVDGLQLEFKQFQQVFTFGQNNNRDCGSGHRPLWRLSHPGASLYPDRIRVPSWRLLNGDKRANPAGRVPLDVWEFPRVTGNSKERRSWHPTQLHPGLVERALLLTVPEGGSVIDPFGGTGTTLRVCNKLGFDCTLIEIDSEYCRRIMEEEHGKG